MFHVWMAVLFVVIAFGGFVPTYWAKMAAGEFRGAPILHIHGAIFFSWTLFYLAQTLMVAQGKLRSHRSWGMAGISLATAMVFTVVLAAINSIKVADAIGMADQARRFSIVSLSAAVLFSALFALAIANVSRPEIHKRLLLLANIPLMQAALARVFMTLFSPPDAVGPPPVIVSVPSGLLMSAVVVVPMLYDWRTRGRPHPVYLIGMPVLLAVILLAIPISETDTWMGIARFVEKLAG
jgi:hypothetical protein